MRFQRAGTTERQVIYLHIGVLEVGVQPLSGHNRLGLRHRVDNARRGIGGGGLRDGRRRGIEARGDPEPRHPRRQRRPAPELRRACPSDPARAKKTTMEELLDVLAWREGAGGRGIDEAMATGQRVRADLSEGDKGEGKW